MSIIERINRFGRAISLLLVVSTPLTFSSCSGEKEKELITLRANYPVLQAEYRKEFDERRKLEVVIDALKNDVTKLSKENMAYKGIGSLSDDGKSIIEKDRKRFLLINEKLEKERAYMQSRVAELEKKRSSGRDSAYSKIDNDRMEKRNLSLELNIAELERKLEFYEYERKSYYSFESLTRILGNDWNNLSLKEKESFKKRWEITPGKLKSFIFDICSNPRGIYHSLNPKEKSQFNSFDVRLAIEKYSKNLAMAFPWFKPDIKSYDDILNRPNGFEITRYGEKLFDSDLRKKLLIFYFCESEN